MTGFQTTSPYTTSEVEATSMPMTWTIKLDKGKPINWPGKECAGSGEKVRKYEPETPRNQRTQDWVVWLGGIALPVTRVRGCRREARSDEIRTKSGKKRRTESRAGRGGREDHPDEEPGASRAVDRTAPRDDGSVNDNRGKQRQQYETG